MKTSIGTRLCPGFRGNPCGKEITLKSGYCSARCQGYAFEDKAQDFLRGLGWIISRNVLIDGSESDIIAKRWDGFNNVSYLVECKSGVYQKQKYLEITERLCSIVGTLRPKGKIDYGLLIFEKKPSPAAVTFGKNNFVTVLSLDDLVSNIVDIDGYKDYLSALLKSVNRAFGDDPFYVTQSARKDEDRGRDASECLKEWIESPHSGLLAINGRSGIGKTTLLLRIAHEYADRTSFTKGKPLVLVVRVKDLLGIGRDIGHGLADYLRDATGSGGLNYQMLKTLLERYRAILILDAIDEFPIEKDEYRTLLLRLQDFLKENASIFKIILSSRDSTIFEREFGLGSESIEFVYVEPFNKTILCSNITKREVDATLKARLLDAIKNNVRLSELVTIPLLFQMLRSVIRKGGQPDINSVQSRGHLYELFSEVLLENDKWIMRDKRSDMIDKLKGISFQIWDTGEKYYIPKTEGDNLNCSSFLVTNDRTKYFFCHESFYEYWIAVKLAEDIKGGSTTTIGRRRFTQLIPEIIAYKLSLEMDRIYDICKGLLNVVLNGENGETKIINTVEILGEMNQIKRNIISDMVLGNDEIYGAMCRNIDYSDSGYVKEAILNFLSILGSKASCNQLIEMYRHPEFSVLNHSAFGLQYYGSMAVFLEELRRITLNPLSNYDRVTCAWCLGEYGSIDDVEVIRSIFGENDPFAKEVALEAIAKLRNRRNE